MTLEPRLFYLYVPFRDHEDIPRFDTGNVSPNYASLFLENRFTGADRLGDANQLTTALSSRFLSAGNSAERFRVSIGQIRYFRDREVTLTNIDPEEDNTSDWFAEGVLNLRSDLSLRGTLQWDPDEDETQRNGLDLRYRPGPGRLINVSRRFTRNTLDQVDFSFLWDLNPRWRAVGRWNYSMDLDRQLDVLAGLEYNDCCWALRVVARKLRDEPEDEEANKSIFVELELKGLTSIGRRVDVLLEEAISGYEPTSYR